MSKHKRPAAPARFAVGSKVRVKPGTMDPDFEDFPLGGWAGTITEVYQDHSPPNYLIQLDRYTLEHMHPIYRKRCERDDMDFESMCLGEDDLVPDDGTPPRIEQPKIIRTRPLNPKDQDDRVRAALGLTSDDPLPDADDEMHGRYYRYLKQHLSFPFPGTWTQEAGFMRDVTEKVTVVGLLDVEEIDDMYGLLCQARQDGRLIDVPLDQVEVKKGDPNRRLVEDYSYWFGNYR